MLYYIRKVINILIPDYIFAASSENVPSNMVKMRGSILFFACTKYQPVVFSPFTHSVAFRYC